MQPSRINDFFTGLTLAAEYSIGGTYLLNAAASAKSFIDAFCDPPTTVHPTLRPVETMRSRVETRIVSFVGFVGASARFLDWGNDKGWFVIVIVDTVFLKIVGHLTGVIRYLMNCIEILDRLEELDRLNLISHHWQVYKHDEFESYRYTLWLNYFSYLAFSFGSGLQCASLVVGITALATTMNFLLTAGVVCFVVAIALEQMCADPTMKLDRLRSLDQQSRYSYITYDSVYSVL